MKSLTAKPKKPRQTKEIKNQNCLYNKVGGDKFLCQHGHRIIAMNKDRERIIIEELTKRGMYENQN